MRISPETGFPGVYDVNKTRWRVGVEWGKEGWGHGVKFSPSVLFTSSPNTVHFMRQKLSGLSYLDYFYQKHKYRNHIVYSHDS